MRRLHLNKLVIRTKLQNKPMLIGKEFKYLTYKKTLRLHKISKISLYNNKPKGYLINFSNHLIFSEPYHTGMYEHPINNLLPFDTTAATWDSTLQSLRFVGDVLTKMNNIR